MDQATDSLARWRSNIHLISQLIQNDVSSTKVCSISFSRKRACPRCLLHPVLVWLIPFPSFFLFFFSHRQVRLFLRRGLSVRYLLPNSVVDYIEQNGLYQDETVSTSEKGKERDREIVPGSSKSVLTSREKEAH